MKPLASATIFKSDQFHFYSSVIYYIEMTRVRGKWLDEREGEEFELERSPLCEVCVISWSREMEPRKTKSFLARHSLATAGRYRFLSIGRIMGSWRSQRNKERVKKRS